jgi:GTP-binding protein
MLPVVAIVGRPNVGKSTLFNCLTRSRDALVADLPGLTRDRQYGQGHYHDQAFIVIDTGGLTGFEKGLDDLMAKQTLMAVNEADVILFLVDGRSGLTPVDQSIAQALRERGKPLKLLVNKTEGKDAHAITAEFHALGLGNPIPIAAAHGQGVQAVLQTVLSKFEKTALPAETNKEDKSTHVAIIGRPNAGKSTLVNRILGEERVVVFDAPGTTRDSIFIPMERRGKRYTLIDTAGVRRRGKVTETAEKFSVIKTLQAITACHVVVMVVDAREGISEQDLSLLGYVLETGKSLLIAVNKWDGLTIDARDHVRKELDRRLVFVDYAKIHFISALHGTGVGDLFTSIDKAYASANKKLSTPQVTRMLEAALAAHQPPLVRGRRVKLRYAHAGGHNPPIIVIHGNQTKALPLAYRRYLANYYRKALKLVGTPVHLEFKDSENPYAGRKNPLTPGQIKRRRRMMQHVKKRK